MSKGPTHRYQKKTNARQVVRVDGAGNEEKLGPVDDAAEKVPCEPRTLQKWLADGKEHYGYLYRYEDGKGCYHAEGS